MDSDSDVNFYDDSVSDNDVDSYDHSVSEDDVDSHDDLVSDNDIDFHDDSICDEDQKMKNYTILSTRDIRRVQKKDVASVCSLLSVPTTFSRILLYHYKWNIESLMEAWFADEERVRKEVGLVQKDLKTSIDSSVRFTCAICFDVFRARDQIMIGFCDHKYCRTCLGTYISTAIDDGPGCLSLRCPDPSCNAAIGVRIVNLLVSPKYRKKFRKFFVRSYVEGNSKVKWCPAPYCDAAVEYNGDGECGSYEVVCGCSFKFCWRCSGDGHRPVDCDTVAEWIKKNKSEASSVDWILAYTKPCPNCKRPIQKGRGCMHMTCNKMCKHEFCWTCLGPWSQHKNCNTYKAKQNDETIRETNRRKNAKASLERYTHYYERWDANHRSRIKAQSDLKEMETENLDILCEKFAATKLQLTCVEEAWQQIIECRRTLKWSYAYGYFIPEGERAKARLFEYLQGEAEAGLERLHQCVEKELFIILKDVHATADQFDIFRVKLVQLTNVTRNYFANLVTALENNLCESESRGMLEEKTSKEMKRKKGQFKKQKEKRRKG
ncbi:RBR-type E3 ubiquitin transferase [Heracleum sosnowskyi]|uniref:RBR-type E3 ubiquitin transferase n=1 Tax=Heracleum sosnowskyi TaxID=360622 RepID=A0AAD8M8K4_9APIA|nr:RBR-type E3 ubiquitin transferase [Heracleum sosnowskyi]